MYRSLVDEINALTTTNKQTLLSAYRHFFLQDSPLLVADIKDLQQDLPYIMTEKTDNNTQQKAHEEVVAVFGLDTRETMHQLIINQKTLYTWCIWDAFFIADALQLPAKIVTTDPMTKETLTADFITGEWSVDTGYWVSFPENSAQMQANLRGAFCSFVQLFANEQTATTTHANTGCGVYSIETLLLRSIEMAQAINPSLNQ